MWTAQFQGLSQLSSETQKILNRDATIKNMKQGTVLFGPGTAPDQLLFLINGFIRVQQVSPSGREIVLYRVNADHLKDMDIKLHFSEVKGPVTDRLQKTDFFDHVTGNLYLTHYQAMCDLT
jgi:CRP-like cAMP-binding protein